MKVEPVFAYRRLKYPRIGEEIKPVNSMLPKALIAATLALTGALPVYAGAQQQRSYISEREIVQIFRYEAEKFGITFDSELDTSVKLTGSDIDVALNLYNEEKQIGAAVLPRDQVNKITQGPLIERQGLKTTGKREDEQDVNIFLTTDYNFYTEDDLRQAFREFIEWLQSEGII